MLRLVPAPLRRFLPGHLEAARFLVVGGICYVVTCAVTYALKLGVLAAHPVTALTAATVLATILSYVLNRQWAFRARGGRPRYTEATLFFAINAVATVINALPLWASRHLLGLHTPEVSRAVQEAGDFLFGLVAGTALAMVFRLWAYRTWVFPRATPTSGPGRSSR